MTTEPILQVSNLTVQFGGVIACDDLSFEVNPGELFALIGPNGAGKTTLVNAVTGIYEPRPGASVKFSQRNGETIELLDYRPHQIARMGIARTFQNLGVFSAQTVLDNLMLGRFMHERTNIFHYGLFTSVAVKKELEARQVCQTIVELLDLGDVRDELVSELSYGIQKRVELGRVLAMDPNLLMLDEPMAGMNAEEKQEMVRYIYRIMDEYKTSVFMIEHDMGIIMAIAERIMVLEFGREIATGLPDEIQANPAVINAYLGAET
ncbi:MAG: ABC transporter ATP-binding protein [Acidimicrobiaceae bacterium]|jgi:branched-chain amino acid transport system ATP-binding protein|nr:ABC transporter ATP-binding protein [Acidimicrobiaceae bacterium]